VGVQITDTDTGNLELWLLKDEQPVPLAQNTSTGGPAGTANFGGGTGCTGGMTIFDSFAPLRIFEGVNPYAGSFRPTQNNLQLTPYNGAEYKGTWRLLVLDDGPPPPLTTGTINCFQLTVKYKAE